MGWSGFPDRCHHLFCYREEVGDDVYRNIFSIVINEKQ